MVSRIKQHLKDKRYRNDCIAEIGNDDLLSKAHVRYIENKFCNFAQESGRAAVINSNIPACSSVSGYDEAMLIEFINNARILVNVLGYKIFDSVRESVVKKNRKMFVCKGYIF